MPAQVTPDELQARLVSRIRELAKARRMSIEELARRSDISQRQIWNVLAGRSVPLLTFVAKVAAGLEVDPSVLFRPPRRS